MASMLWRLSIPRAAMFDGIGALGDLKYRAIASRYYFCGAVRTAVSRRDAEKRDTITMLQTAASVPRRVNKHV